MAQLTPARVLAILGFADWAFASSGSSLPVHKLALRRLKKRRAIAVAQALAMTLAIALPLSLQFVSTISADAGYQGAIDARSRDSLVTIEKSGAQNPQSYRAAQEDTQRSVDFNTHSLLGEVSEYARASSFVLASVNGQPFGNDLGLPRLNAVFYPQLPSNGVLVAGSWPAETVRSEPIPVVLSETGASFYGLRIGDVMCLTSSNDLSEKPTQTCLTLIGLYRARDASDPFWLSAPGSSDVVFSSSGYWRFEQLVRFTRSIAGRAYRPAPAMLTVANGPALEQGVTHLRGAVQYSEGQTVLTTLDHSIAVFLRRNAVNQFPVQLVAVEVIAVVLYGLGFVTQSFLSSQEQQAALWRIRGWSRKRLSAFLLVQFIALALPAVIAALGIAIATTWLVAAAHRADLASLTPDLTATFSRSLGLSLLACAALCVALTARFAVRPVSVMRQALAGSHSVGWWRRGRVDLLAAALAVPVLFEASLRTQDSVRSATAGADYVGVGLPILGLGMLSLATLRLLPILARPLTLGSRGIPARLSFWRLSRQSAEHAGAAMVLSLTLGIGAFASVYDRTETTNAVDRADYAAGADVRIAFSAGSNPASLRDQLGRVKGIRAMTPVLRQGVYPNGSSEMITALGVDPTTFAPAAWSRPGLSSPALVPTVRQMATAPGYIELSKPISRLSVYVRGLGQPATLDVDLRDASGQRCSCSLGDVAFSDWRQLQLEPSFTSPPHYPLRLYSFRIGTASALPSGDVGLSFLEATYEGAGGTSVVESFQNTDGWWVRSGDGLTFAPAAGPPLRIGTPTLDVPVSGSGQTTINAPFTGSDVPLLMAAPIMARLGLHPGTLVPLSVGGRELVARLVGAVDYVPTLYPGSDDFIVMPLDRMVGTFSAVSGSAEVPNEIWLKMTSAGWASAMALGPSTTVDYVVNRQTAERQALNDPVLIQLRAMLTMGFASAVALGIVSFTVHFLIATRRRLAEHSVLEANGLDPEDIRKGIAIEQGVLVVFAILVGVALTVVEVEVLLNSLQLGPGPADTIPPTVLRVDVFQLGVGVVAAALLIAVLGWVTRRIATAINVVEELRRLG